jgi:catechol 2,3-dioxygenase-like lactoylglutathione lyase family enzyme
MKGSEAILAVRDVREAVRFYRDVLGFEGEWLWEDPPTFGAVRWGTVQVMFGLQPELAARVEGHQHSFRVEDVDGLYARQRAAGVEIVSKIGTKPWGVREYTVRDPNGYHLRFMGPPTYERPATATVQLPANIRIERRLPTADEIVDLAVAVGWNGNGATAAAALAGSLMGVVAVDVEAGGRALGAARVVGDGARCFFVQDVTVRPEYQGQKVGTAMMEAVMGQLREAAPKGAFVGLFTARPGFYEKHGFVQGQGMSLFL